MNKARRIEDTVHRLTKELADKGKLIEGGFAAFALYVIPKDAPPVQLSEMRLAYMAGAEHLFSSIMSILSPEAELTESDLRRMDLIAKEIDAWRVTLSERVDPVKGHA